MSTQHSGDSLSTDILEGAVAGIVATGAMSAEMWTAKKLLPFWERYPLPPKLITVRIAERLGLGRYLHREQRNAATIAAHIGYGAVGGVVFGLLTRWIPAPPVLSGIVFGLGVWAGSYLGWLPGLGIMSPATQHPRRRNVLMIVAHVIYGAVMGLVVGRLRPRGS